MNWERQTMFRWSRLKDLATDRLTIWLLILAALTMGGEAGANGMPAGFQKWQVNDTTARTRMSLLSYARR